MQNWIWMVFIATTSRCSSHYRLPGTASAAILCQRVAAISFVEPGERLFTCHAGVLPRWIAIHRGRQYLLQFVVDYELGPQRWLAMLVAVMLLQEVKRSRRTVVDMRSRLWLIGCVSNHAVHWWTLTHWLIADIETMTLAELVHSRATTLTDAWNSNYSSPG